MDTVGPAPSLDLQPLEHCRTLTHSQPQAQPQPHIFASYLEETCRLLAADGGLSDAMDVRFPHAAATDSRITAPARRG